MRLPDGRLAQPILIEGAGAASEIYFRKSVSTLTLAEALTLAVIPQSPARRSSGDDTATKTDSAKTDAATGTDSAKSVSGINAHGLIIQQRDD